VAAAGMLSHATASAQQCGPGQCVDGTFVLIDFESLAPGTGCEGLGALHPDLDVASVAWSFSPSCPTGTAKVIQENNAFPYASYGAGVSDIDNDCLNGFQGMGDSANCVLDYDFTFGPGVAVTCFGLRMLDYGDYYPYGGAAHIVQLSAYDASNTLVDQDVLGAAGGVNLVTGDACATDNGTGNVRLNVFGSAITKVTLRFNQFPDPNVGFDDITFCELLATPALPKSWGGVKATYR
jgi:hypothetical protein